tara:strand:- start:201 stop:1340 length:1140 start_codon:yes stop_codon:yes gene_type:complete
MGSYVEIGGWYAKEVVNMDFLTGYSMWSWGEGDDGVLGLNQSASGARDRSSPTQVPGKWNQVVGVNALSDKSIAYGFGHNFAGMLGVGDATARSSPTQVVGGGGFIELGGARTSRRAVKGNGTLWSWGSNSAGILGQNSNQDFSSPVQIPGTTWSKPLIGGEDAAGCIKTDGTLWMWGNNQYGQLAQNNEGPSTQHSSPKQVPGTTWKDIAGTDDSYLAVKTDGTMWAWGNNEGVGGDGDILPSIGTDRSSPIQIPGTTWNKIATNTFKSYYAIKTDGTLWSWGYNPGGLLGQNNVTKSHSPAQIPGTTWSEISAISNIAAMGLKTDNTMWVWGNNDVGQLGLNNRTQYSSPVQIPGTWLAVGRSKSGKSSAIAFKAVT